MNSTPFKKRSDPFVSSTPVSEPKPVESAPQPVAAPKAVKPAVDESNREKYTATMDKNLRKRLKVAAAMNGIQVSTFIEQACLEKLEREGN